MNFCNLCQELVEDCTCLANLPEIEEKIQTILRGKDGKDFAPEDVGPFCLTLQSKIRHAMINVENFEVFKETLLEITAYTLATLQKYQEVHEEWEKEQPKIVIN